MAIDTYREITTYIFGDSITNLIRNLYRESV